ncbi:hypothetical protein MC7420_3640 [Coleofasciculus chthonoplastes PCC 7420]|uniref:Uncharacterized protein n=1 Tax=Coleofasciculus chthonoplastes PCC 7420 TaxID=118168 RepID=B4VX14_9CYAN|nr:hypothetical protein MC7420_3640 [Coleofasciculus chthonoplastes PCC 7420]
MLANRYLPIEDFQFLDQSNSLVLRTEIIKSHYLKQIKH